ncbi:hypothetical protein TNCV_3579991 [Trichonephila clavipes]|nr:hypothetical protein TNCV_3579991 [Trichonephila clavipes]
MIACTIPRFQGKVKSSCVQRFGYFSQRDTNGTLTPEKQQIQCFAIRFKSDSSRLAIEALRFHSTRLLFARCFEYAHVLRSSSNLSFFVKEELNIEEKR